MIFVIWAQIARFIALRNLVLFGDRIVLDGRKEIGVIITLIKKR